MEGINMRSFSTIHVQTTILSILMIAMIFIPATVTADPGDNEIGSCWGGDWGNVFGGVGMIVMMSIGMLAVFIVLLFIAKNESFLSPLSKNAESFQTQAFNNNGPTHNPPFNNAELSQTPLPDNTITSHLDQRYARGEISQEEYISQSLDNFINRFTDEE
jgi:hypothetical protein